MTTPAVAYLLALSLFSAIVLVLGERGPRWVASAEIVAFALTRAARALQTPRFAYLSPTIAAIDIALLLVVIVAASRSRRPWIALTASILVFPVLGHFAKMLDARLWPSGYWLMTNLPAAFCLCLLALGASEAIQKQMRRSAISRL